MEDLASEVYRKRTVASAGERVRRPLTQSLDRDQPGGAVAECLREREEKTKCGGRVVGAATVSRLHADPVFRAQLEAARREVEAARASGAKSPLDCAAEERALKADR